jgi:trehalose/maltose transport system substrate-binding protein
VEGRASVSTRRSVLPIMRSTSVTGTLLFAMLLAACHQSAPEPVTLNYFRLGWSQPDELPTAEPLSQRFTRETGIRLKNLPVPENTLDQLDLSRRLLEGNGSGPDVVNVDMIWSGVLEKDLVDLQPHSVAEISSIAPSLVPSYRVDQKLVAIPYQVQVGTLEYRADLLREYGYTHPPATWDELEQMAERIQRGERAKGNEDFWGYVWQGADAEALTCNALEWQASEGGGRIIEDDRTISVNNPAAIRSWQRARRWIGRISPPSVVAFRELDSINAFDSGKAAFNRVWGGTTITRGGQHRQFHGRPSPFETKNAYAIMPGGAAGSAGTLGGSGLAVSQHSPHVAEAIRLVQFLIRAQIQSNLVEDRAFVDTPQVQVDSRSASFGKSAQNTSGVVNRPSSVVGDKYEDVSRAYISAVHSVLTGEKGAPEAAAGLEKVLVQMTGFRTGPPKSTD